MDTQSSRRRFLGTAAGLGGTLAAHQLGIFNSLGHVSAADARLDSGTVQLDSEIEPLVRLLEDTPRERLLEEVAVRIRSGTSYREVLAALLLAGVRNVEPRPSVGFKFHTVLVVNSAHLASLDSPDEDRWLPIFWALDYFKEAQAKDESERGWTMRPVDEAHVPKPSHARAAFIEAMENWDVEKADVAVAALARSAGSEEVFELFYRFGARDFRSIGHKAIFVANSRRTLQCIGWQHAEPVLRSLAYALLNYDGDNPATNDTEPDRPWRANIELAKQIPDNWRDGTLDDTATTEMLHELRTSDYDATCRLAAEMLARGVSPASIWDAAFGSAAELVARSPGIISLHAVTTANALAHAYQTTSNDNTRRMLLLQAVAFVPLFRQAGISRGSRFADNFIDELQPAEIADNQDTAVEDIFATLSNDETLASQKTLALLDASPNPRALVTAARRLIFAKGSNAHDYKYSSAVLEDYQHLSPAWRNRFLASSMYLLRGSGDRDNGLVARTRAALA